MSGAKICSSSGTMISGGNTGGRELVWRQARAGWPFIPDWLVVSSQIQTPGSDFDWYLCV